MIDDQNKTPPKSSAKAKEDKIFYDNVMLNSINLYGEKPVVL